MASVPTLRLSAEGTLEYRRLRTIEDINDPWPTPEDALRSARVAGRILADFHHPEVESVWLYGSRARGDHHEESDFDLLMVGDLPARHKVDCTWAALTPFFGDLIVYRIRVWAATSEQWHIWDTMFYRSVREDAIRVWPPDPPDEGRLS